MLSTAGGLAGLLLAAALHRGLLALVADRIPIPRLDQVSLDPAVVAFTVAVVFATGVLFGIVPALVATSSATHALREGGRHGSGPRSRRVLAGLVVAEVALSLVLLAGAGLLLRSFLRLQNVSPGFRPEGVLTARVQLPPTRYSEDAQRVRFYSDAIDRIASVPGVRSAAGVTFLPMSGPGIGTGFWRLDRPQPAPGQAPTTEVRPITPGFLRTMGIPHLAGRDFQPTDTADSTPVAIVGDTLVRSQFRNENPIGRRLHVNVGTDDGMDVEIVGVVGDIKMATLENDTRPAIYLPHTQLTFPTMTFVMRTDGEPLALANGVSGAVHTLDRGIPLADVRTMEDVVNATLAQRRTIAVLLAAFALMALALAAVGVYGMMSYSVSQRTQEIGVRIALGATSSRVMRLVLRQALGLVAVGIAVGLLTATLATRLLATLLYETEPIDPWTFAATAVLLMLVATCAVYLPARRGTRVAPVAALRCM